MLFPVFFSIARDNFLHRAHRLSAFASNFPFATMVNCTKQQEIYQESQRSDVTTGNAGWPSQTQTQTQRCGALSPLNPTPATCHKLPWAICRNVLEDFCCINFGGFSRRFSWRIFLGTFSHKNEDKKSGEKIRETIRRLKDKNPRKIRSAESRP